MQTKPIRSFAREMPPPGVRSNNTVRNRDWIVLFYEFIFLC